MLAGVAVLLVTLVLALALDLARWSRARAELQLQADAAALSAAHGVGLCAANAVDPGDPAEATSQANGFVGALTQSPSSVEFGSVANVAGARVFTETDELDSAEAVHVVATRSIPKSQVLPGTFTGDIDLTVRATARTHAIASLRAGSGLVTADAEPSTVPLLNDVLGGLLGGSVGLSALSYQGLLSADLTLAGLVEAHGGAGGITGLLDTQLTAGELFGLVAGALSARGESAAAAAVGALEVAAPNPQAFRLGDLIHIAAGSEESALDTSLNAFDLVSFGALAANGGSSIIIDPLSISVPGIADASLKLTVVEPPQLAIGPPGRTSEGAWRTELRTAQLRLELSLTAATALTLVGSAPVTLTSYANIAAARVYLESIACRRAGEDATVVRVGVEPGLTDFGLGTFGDIESSSGVGPSIVTELTLLGAPLARVSVSESHLFTPEARTLDFQGPFVPWIDEPAEAHTQTTATDLDASLSEAGGALGTNLTLQVQLLGLPPLGVGTSQIRTATQAIVGPLLALLPTVWAPLLQGIGADLNGADVTVLAVHTTRPTLLE